MLGAEDGCNHPQPTGSNRPLICGREACFGAFWGVWDACIKRNVKTSHRDPPSAAARRKPRHPMSSLQDSTPMRANVQLRLRTAMQMYGCVHACRKGYAEGGFFWNASCASVCALSCAKRARASRSLALVRGGVPPCADTVSVSPCHRALQTYGESVSPSVWHVSCEAVPA